MNLSAIWYIAAIVANVAVIVVFVYMAVLATACYLERRLDRQGREKNRRRGF